jgi:hypothetical protein
MQQHAWLFAPARGSGLQTGTHESAMPENCTGSSGNFVCTMACSLLGSACSGRVSHRKRTFCVVQPEVDAKHNACVCRWAAPCDKRQHHAHAAVAACMQHMLMCASSPVADAHYCWLCYRLHHCQHKRVCRVEQVQLPPWHFLSAPHHTGRLRRLQLKQHSLLAVAACCSICC